MSRLSRFALILLIAVNFAGCSSTESPDAKSTDKNASDKSDNSAGATAAKEGQSKTNQAAQKFDTPQAAFAAFDAAAKANDYAAIAAIMSDESQRMMASGFVMGAGFMTLGDEKKGKEVEALLAKHGIDINSEEPPAGLSEDASQEEMMKAMTAPIKDLPAFIAEMGAWVDKNSESPGLPKVGALGEVTIDGDSATALCETERGPQPIEFKKVDGGWQVHLPMDGPADDDAAAFGEESLDMDATEDDGSPGIGTLMYDGKEVTLRHALAYKSKHFDDPCTVLLLTARPIADRDIDALKKMLKEDGADDAFFVRGPNVKLSLDENGEPLFLFAWVENMSINANSGVEADLTLAGDRVQGTVGMTEPGEIADKEYSFDATVDVELLKVE